MCLEHLLKHFRKDSVEPYTFNRTQHLTRGRPIQSERALQRKYASFFFMLKTYGFLFI